LGIKSIRKGLKTLPITQVDNVQWHGWPHQPAGQKPNKNARLYRFLLRADKSLDSRPPKWATDGSNIHTADFGNLRFWAWVDDVKQAT
jgi:hypothetical protein